MALRLTDKVDLDVYYDADYFGRGDWMRPAVSRALFKATYAGCPSVGFECDGRPIGGMIFDGESAHLAVLPSHHGRWGRLLKPMLAWLYGLKAEVVVRIDACNDKALAFAQRCGWERLRSGGGGVYYRMTAGGANPVARIARGEAPSPADQSDPCPCR